ncbi:unnamed protein product [Polarella glacialis]|uniref:oligopeptidase A n=2 Tax=Polarella glacialis TaxID=89957 RepID=A0A813H1E6_POLGL|nr:unnamed protein product [Polarella glacialis]
MMRLLSPLLAVTVALQFSYALALRHATPVPNPLLANTALPPLARVTPDQVKPAVQSTLAVAENSLTDLEQALSSKLKEDEGPVPYEQILPPLLELYDSYGKPWGLFSHLRAVRDSPQLRAIEDELRPAVVAFGQRLSQSKPIYSALARLNQSSSFASLTEAQQRAVRSELLDRKLGGVALEGAQAEEFNKLQRELSELSSNYSTNVLDAQAAWNMTLTAKDEVKGIPARALEGAADAARKAGHEKATAEDGPWLVSLDGTVMDPVLSYCENRELRETMFRASDTVASSGPHDNSEVLKKILQIRQQNAELLGFSNYDELSLATKMASHDAVTKLLQEVRDAARPAAQKDDLELRDFARSGAEVDGQKLPALEDLQKWDHFFYSQRLLLARYAVDREALRVYFPFPAAIKGLQGLTHRLFGVTLEPVHGEVAAAAKWHADVELFQVARGKELMGYVMVDPFSRPGEKRAGGWMQQLVSREQRPSKQPRLPVAAVMTNFPQPQEGKPSLLSLEEVSTLFHEFGHAMQHVLTVQNESSVSGINGIEWDAVEVASQFMEYWVDYDRQTLFSMARHYETGEPLPEESYKKLLVAKNFRSGTGLLGQVYLATMDLRLHEGYKEGEDPDGIAKAVGREVLINPPLPEGRPLCSFSHIFDGGYAAGYYSYLWSQVLSADAFNAFDTAGNLTVTQALVNFGAQDSKGEDAVEKLGRRWASTVLADGGGRAPEKVFIDFLGRQPSAAALLHYSGLDLPGALV